ncbi:hypothetical protein GCM10009678_26300 [Actinomadura kijaniata]|uniref:Protein kinase domain-containing protein n=1 Tax=Actinomadura namibiensis TaxID=182080 RepID=A0A7W3LUM4_ACTNM|nr:serine/threonine-protein kinase [Actinomadura namibiensis]MBA8954618.1 hypothetical protein [Actinomadura namibiensis]
MRPLRPGDPAAVGGYPLLGRLGEGGMGLVYLALADGGRHIALKVVRDGLDDPQTAARFRREARTVARVRSRHAAAMVAAGLDAPPFWLATEYVPGPTLRQAVERHGPLPAGTCLRLLAALASGLADVHGQGVQHRDVKPANVVLAPDGPRLIDFGIARGEDQTQITRTGGWNGTPGYVAPEVVREQAFGPAADVFSLAVTVAYAATGRPPFGTGPLEAVLLRTLNGDLDLSGVDGRLAALLAEALAGDPSARPAPARLAERCEARGAFTDDPAYRDATSALTLPVPPDVPTAVRQGLVTPEAGSRSRTPAVVAGAAVAAVVLGAALGVRLLDSPDQRPRGTGPTVTVSAPARPTFGGEIGQLEGGRKFGTFLTDNINRRVAIAARLAEDVRPRDDRGRTITAGSRGHTSATFTIWTECFGKLSPGERPTHEKCTGYQVAIGGAGSPWDGMGWAHGALTFQGNFEVSGGTVHQGVTVLGLKPVPAD